MRKWLVLVVLSLPVGFAGCAHPRPVAYYPPPPPPPPAFAEAARQGFQAGVGAARHDIRSGAPPDIDRHPRFRNPPVPPPAVEAYRRGFRNGYEQVIHPPPPPA